MPIRSIDRTKCTDCGKCYQVCSMDVFQRVGRTVYIAYPEDCMCCFLCETDCPVEGAIIIDAERSRTMPFPY